MFTKKQQLEILTRNINLGGFVRDQIDLALEPALEKLVSDSTTPLDDVAKDALYPPLRAEMEKLIVANVDGLFARLLSDEEADEEQPAE